MIASFALACAWSGWIPGESSWNPDIVVDPSELAKQLSLDTIHVDELDCYANSCEKRFRLVIDQPGQLTVTAIPELSSQDDQARIVLESLQGVVAKAATGRGSREDVTVLSVSKPLDPGMYFVLIQSVGGTLPYQLSAHLTPGAGAPVTPEAEPRAQAATPSSSPPARLVAVSLPGNSQGAYDPAVSFGTLRTFAFRNPGGQGAEAPAGTRIEDPIDREIRRYLADELTLRGLQQVGAGDAADLSVGFYRRSRNRSLYGFASIYGRYDFGALGWTRGAVDTRSTLTVDIVDSRNGLLAWHAWTTKGIGPGITYGDATSALVRESINDVLAGFPPR